MFMDFLATNLAANVPDVNPDFNFPGARGFIQVISWALGGGLLFCMLALLFCFLGIATKGFGNQQLQRFSASSIVWVVVITCVIGAFSTVFQFIIGFDLGL